MAAIFLPAGRGLSAAIYNVAGNDYYFPVPANCHIIWVSGCGGGYGGGGGGGATNGGGGAGGSSATCVWRIPLSVVPGSVLGIQVGFGGLGAVAGSGSAGPTNPGAWVTSAYTALSGSGILSPLMEGLTRVFPLTEGGQSGAGGNGSAGFGGYADGGAMNWGNINISNGGLNGYTPGNGGLPAIFVINGGGKAGNGNLVNANGGGLTNGRAWFGGNRDGAAGVGGASGGGGGAGGGTPWGTGGNGGSNGGSGTNATGYGAGGGGGSGVGSGGNGAPGILIIEW